MYQSPAFSSLEAIAAALPYHIDDMDAANETFRRFCRDGTERDQRDLALWTYCYILRYFMVKFLRQPPDTPSDLEALIDKTFRKVERHRPDLPCDTRYPNWLSVVCKNTYLNYVRRPRQYLSLDDPDLPPVAAVTPPEPNEAYQHFDAAIGRLPASLQQIARLRLLEDRAYPDIARLTGKPLPTVRTYVNKALKRLRDDLPLKAYLEAEHPDYSNF